MKERFIDRRFSIPSTGIIEAANAIINDGLSKGISLSMRQVYYAMVRKGAIENKQSEYKRLASIMSDARLAGLTDWDSIEEQMRGLRTVPSYPNAGEFMRHLASQYAEDLWASQPNYCEVWVEKEGLIGTIERACEQYRVPYVATRGYASQSGLYEAGRRLRDVLEREKQVWIFYLGDHDPHGLEMSRDLAARLKLFARSEKIRVERVALSQAQIAYYDLPADPVPITDVRLKEYAEQFGTKGWELEAFPAAELRALIVSSIANIIEPEAFRSAEASEAKTREFLKQLAREQ